MVCFCSISMEKQHISFQKLGFNMTDVTAALSYGDGHFVCLLAWERCLDHVGEDSLYPQLLCLGVKGGG